MVERFASIILDDDVAAVHGAIVAIAKMPNRGGLKLFLTNGVPGRREFEANVDVLYACWYGGSS